MRKKGSERFVLFYVIMLLLGVVVGFTTHKGVKNFLDDTTYWKEFYARDLGLLLDTSITGRGVIDMHYNFEHTNKPLTMKVKEFHIEIYDANDKATEPVPTYFRFASNDEVNVWTGDMKSSFFKIYVDDKQVLFDITGAEKEACSNIYTKADSSSIKIYVQSSSAFKETLIGALQANGFNVVPEITGSDVIIILEQGTEEGVVAQYYNTDNTNQKFICNIKNSMVEKDESQSITHFFIRKIPAMHKFEDELAKSGTSVFIEMNELRPELISAIADGVKTYYG